MKTTRFHRHYPSKGFPLYWILIAYLILGYFFPLVGWAALVCMIAPVAVAVWRGRWWCGKACPRGSLFDRLLSKYSPHRSIPSVVRSFGFRLFIVLFIFTVFGIQTWQAWGDWQAIGRVFWRIVLFTTLAGVVLAFVYAPRTWCSFCPMGTLSAWSTPKRAPYPKAFRAVQVADSCRMKCKSCARVCPMQLKPYESRGEELGYLHPDCIKCGRCAAACPTRIMRKVSPRSVCAAMQ